MELLGTSQVAEILGVSKRRVLALIEAGRLKATRAGSQWVVLRKDLAPIMVRKKGRPAKKKK